MPSFFDKLKVGPCSLDHPQAGDFRAAVLSLGKEVCGDICGRDVANGRINRFYLA